MYQEIFKQGKIGNITLKNRLVMSPMGTNPVSYTHLVMWIFGFGCMRFSL